MPAIWICRDENGMVNAAYVAAYVDPAQLRSLAREGRRPELVVSASIKINAPLPDSIPVIETLTN